MKNITCMVIACFMLATTLASCAGGGVSDNPDTSSVGTTQDNGSSSSVVTESDAFSTVPRADYGGYVFRILYPRTDECFKDFIAESQQNADTLNDAVFNRNSAVENAYNISLVTEFDSIDNISQRIQTMVKNNSDDFDMFGGRRDLLSMSYGGYLTDLYALDGLNLDASWWDKNWLDSISINGSIYALVGDISVSQQLFVSSLCFNKALFTQYELEMPYDMVRSNTWTYDALLNYISEFSVDYNVDGSMKPEDDYFGLTGWGTESGYSLFYASGLTFIKHDNDGTYKIDYDSEQLDNIMGKVYNIWIGADSYFNPATDTSQHSVPFSVFSSDRALFCDIVLSKIGTFFSDMESDYGIVPQPMYNTQQGRYYSYTGYNIPITMVPTTVLNPARNGNIIEALSAASHDIVIPDMYEIVTKIKNVRDEASSEMIEIIISTKIFDAAHWYNLPGYGTLSRSLITGKSTRTANYVSKYSTQAQTQLQIIINNYNAKKG